MIKVLTRGSDLLCISVDRLQPNVDTRQKQLAAWCSLTLSYCRHRKLYTLDVLETQESPLFNNKKIESILLHGQFRFSSYAFRELEVTETLLTTTMFQLNCKGKQESPVDNHLLKICKWKLTCWRKIKGEHIHIEGCCNVCGMYCMP